MALAVGERADFLVSEAGGLGHFACGLAA